MAERPTERCFISSQLLGGVAGVRNVVGAAITQQGLLLRMLPWPVPRVLRIVQSAPLLPAARPPGAEPGLRFLLTHVCTESLLWGLELAGGASGVRGGVGLVGMGVSVGGRGSWEASRMWRASTGWLYPHPHRGCMRLCLLTEAKKSFPEVVVHVCAYVCVRVCVCAHVYVHVCTYVCAYMCACVHVCMCACM